MPHLPKPRLPPTAGAKSRTLSPNMRVLFHCMWQMGYGTIRGVHFRDGDPLLHPPMQIIRKARLSVPPWPHGDSSLADFTLKSEHLRFQQELATADSGVVEIKVVGGLPVDLEIHEKP